MPKYTAFDIANYFLFKAQEEDQELLSNLKLQKLVYYAQGLHLAIEDGVPLFDERIEAWTYGPVIPDLYHALKHHGANGIPVDDSFDPLSIDDEIRKFLDDIYEVFGQFSAVRLMEISHEDDCWKNAKLNTTITLDAMQRDLKKYLVDG